MTDIHHLILEVARPGRRSGYPYGRVEECDWLVRDGYVWLCTPEGTRTGEKRRLEKNVDAETTARRLLKDSLGKKRSSFGRRLEYPVGF